MSTKLNPNPVRPFTDREIARIIGSVVGGLLEWNEREAIRRALEHWLAPGRLETAELLTKGAIQNAAASLNPTKKNPI